jgi:hypothetical protein
MTQARKTQREPAEVRQNSRWLPLVKKVPFRFILLMGLPAILCSYAGAIVLLEWATTSHWLLGAALAVLFFAIVVAGTRELNSLPVSEPLYVIGSNVSGIVVIGSLVAAWISFVLASTGLASYRFNQGATISNFALYYIWVFLNMIPTLRITDTLDWHAPIEPEGLAAGLPVLAFKMLILYGILDALKNWWKLRGEATNDSDESAG